MTAKRLLCMACGSEADQTPDMRACPSCGDASHPPADLSDAVSLTISTHELRILTMWASNWAHSIEERYPGSNKAVSIILDRLATQTDAPLSLSQEIADLRREFGEVRVYRDGNEVDI